MRCGGGELGISDWEDFVADDAGRFGGQCDGRFLFLTLCLL